MLHAAAKKKKKNSFSILLRADWWKGGGREKCVKSGKLMGSETIKARKVAVTFSYENQSCEARMKPNTIT